MAVQNNAPAPLSDPIARPRRPQYKGDNRDPQEGLISDAWTDYFTAQSAVIEKAPARVASVALTDQPGSIGATDMTDGTLTAGLYRLNYYMKITTIEGLGANVTLTLDWTDGGTAYPYSGAALVAGSLISQQASLPIRIDALSPVRYSTTVVSAGTMRYALDVWLEEAEA